MRTGSTQAAAVAMAAGCEHAGERRRARYVLRLEHSICKQPPWAGSGFRAQGLMGPGYCYAGLEHARSYYMLGVLGASGLGSARQWSQARAPAASGGACVIWAPNPCTPSR
jgi:hypothetical protein